LLANTGTLRDGHDPLATDREPYIDRPLVLAHVARACRPEHAPDFPFADHGATLEKVHIRYDPL